MSDSVKDLLQDINIQDTDYAPAGDMFEVTVHGFRVQRFRGCGIVSNPPVIRRTGLNR